MGDDDVMVARELGDRGCGAADVVLLDAGIGVLAQRNTPVEIDWR